MIIPSIAGLRVAGLALLAGGLIAGCAAPDASTMTAPQDPNLVQVFGIYDPEAGFVSAGIYSGPIGTYTVRTSVVGGGDYALTGDRDFVFTTPVDLSTGRSGYVYLQVHQPTWLIAPTGTVTVQEVALPPGTHVDSIRVLFNGVFRPTVIGQSSVTFTVGYNDVAAVKFFNSVGITPPPPPPPSTACTPGYWKQSQHFDSWPSPILPTQLISSRFPPASLYTSKLGNIGNLTLLQGLSLQGGSDVNGSAQILLRAGIAALLNSHSTLLSYPMTETAVLQAVNAALLSGNRDQMLTLGLRLDEYNNARCPLN